MDRAKTLLERAFELAATGQYRTVAEIRYRLKWEGYPEGQLTGPSLTKQLRDKIREHRANATGPEGQK
jgi:hypothetical protein